MPNIINCNPWVVDGFWVGTWKATKPCSKKNCLTTFTENIKISTLGCQGGLHIRYLTQDEILHRYKLMFSFCDKIGNTVENFHEWPIKNQKECLVISFYVWYYSFQTHDFWNSKSTRFQNGWNWLPLFLNPVHSDVECHSTLILFH